MLHSKFYLTKRRNGVYYILIKSPDRMNRWHRSQVKALVPCHT
ncbi:MAG: hypothetical protein V1799_05130 [bacterium]